MEVINRIFRILRSKIQIPSRNREFSELNFHENKYSKSSPDDKQKAQTPLDHYDLKLVEYFSNLEVPYGSDLQEIEKAWRRLLRKYHPDLHANDPEKQRIANELVQELNRACEDM